MRIKIILAGVALTIFGTIGYFYLPNLVSHFMVTFTGTSNSSAMATSILQQIGIPPIDTMDQMMHYSFGGFAGGGIFIIVFGIFTKKKLKKQFPSTGTESNLSVNEHQEDPSQKSIRILKERLAKGEISQNDFRDLKKLIE